MPLPQSEITPRRYRVAEVYVFDTCSMRCGYCWLAESGQVADSRQLAMFRDEAHPRRIAAFFGSRTTTNDAWLVQLTGGEPLLMPNLPVLCDELFRSGNKVAFYSGLFVSETQRNFRYLLESEPANIDYIMASLHPEAEVDEPRWLRKLALLKNAGIPVFLRYVGHPKRLHRLDELARKCEDLDVAFYPTSLLTNRYPAAYTPAEKDLLKQHFSSLSQYIQLEGGADTATLRCTAGSKLIAINLQTGNITPCISVSEPSLGNIYEDRLSLYSSEIQCPSPGMPCLCDVHYQQGIVSGVSDAPAFDGLKKGSAKPRDFSAEVDAMRSSGIRFYPTANVGVGNVQNDERLVFSSEEISERLAQLGPPERSRAVVHTTEVDPLLELANIHPCNGAIVEGTAPLCVTTPAEQWSYAGAFRLPVERVDLLREMTLKVECVVTEGTVGWGLVTADMSTYVGEKEKVIGKGETAVVMTVAASDRPVWCILRNASPAGKPSRITVTKFRTYSSEGSPAGYKPAGAVLPPVVV